MRQLRPGTTQQQRVVNAQLPIAQNDICCLHKCSETVTSTERAAVMQVRTRANSLQCKYIGPRSEQIDMQCGVLTAVYT